MSVVTTNEMLDRAYEILAEIKDDDTKNSVVKPDIQRVTNKMCISNFKAVCKSLNRTEEEMKNYILAELSTSGSINESGSLIINAKAKSKAIMDTVRKYINNCVKCDQCLSLNTVAKKQNRTLVKQCYACKSEKSITS